METVQVSVPAFIEIDIKVLGPETISLAGMSAEWLGWAITNGVKQSVGDADAGHAGTDKGKELIQAKWDKIASGEVPAGGGGGGSRLTIEEQSAREVYGETFKALGLKAKAYKTSLPKHKERLMLLFELVKAAKQIDAFDHDACDACLETVTNEMKTLTTERVEQKAKAKAKIAGIFG